MFAAIFVDIIGPLRVLSLGLQAGDNDPVKALRRIKEFHWTMVKLQASTFGTATFDAFKKDCKAADDDENRLSYQDVVLTNYPVHSMALLDKDKSGWTRLSYVWAIALKIFKRHQFINIFVLF
jgi:hypothetical protein